jgi:UDP-glucose-4-epimerase GalE
LTPHVLVCGGAGYIGSHMCKALADAGIVPVTFDNLSTGHRWAVQWGPLVEGDLLDPPSLDAAFAAYPIDAVLHFAALSLVAESMQQPGLYFRNNVTGTLNLLDAMRAAGVRKLVFSSTAAVYGNPDYTPIDERHPTAPVNPYGWSKLMAERQIAEDCRAHGLRAICLRYFNAAGADPDGAIGEVHEPETHLIPNLLKAAVRPDAQVASIFGDDYDTPDGTCVRDYIHVADLAAAHLRALDRLEAGTRMEVFNLGAGQGNSVAEVLAVCRSVSGAAIPERRLARRPGDPPVLVASIDAARDTLGWQPTKGLADCVADALRWERAWMASRG